mgnify:CR=1 FL=1
MDLFHVPTIVIGALDGHGLVHGVAQVTAALPSKPRRERHTDAG